MKMFSRNFESGEPLFYADDLITIGPDEYPDVAPNSLTTVGLYIFNSYLLREHDIFPYINKPVTGKVVGSIYSAFSKAIMSGDLEQTKFFRFTDKFHWLCGGPMAHVFTTSMSEEILALPPEAKKLKKQRLEENADAIKYGDPIVSSSIEKEVCAKAYEELHDKETPGFILFDSGCGVSFDNNYKTMFVMKGAVQDNTGEYDSGYKVITSDYDNGITREDMPKIADSLITSAYSKGQSTQDGGYSAKKYISRFQNITVDKRGSDCGTTETIKVTLTESNSAKYIYRYIVENKKLILLDDDTMKKYIGKTVNMRAPIHCKCKGSKYCNMCFGEIPYIIGTRNVGLQFNIAPGNILNADMKKFHDITIKTYELSIEKDLMEYPAW